MLTCRSVPRSGGWHATGPEACAGPAEPTAAAGASRGFLCCYADLGQACLARPLRTCISAQGAFSVLLGGDLVIAGNFWRPGSIRLGFADRALQGRPLITERISAMFKPVLDGAGG
jgi:hypothetical protein